MDSGGITPGLSTARRPKRCSGAIMRLVENGGETNTVGASANMSGQVVNGFEMS